MKRVLFALAVFASLSLQAQITASIQSTTVCFGDSTRLEGVASSGSGTINTYVWDLDSDGVFDEDTGATVHFTFPTADSSVVRMRVYDSSGDSLDVIRGILVRALPIAQITTTNGSEICEGDSTTVSWAFNGAAEVSFWTSGQDNEQETVYDSGSFYLTVMDTSTCIGRDSLDIVVHPLPTVTYTGVTEIIVGDSTYITPSGASTYQWSNTKSLAWQVTEILDSTSVVGTIYSEDTSADDPAGSGAGTDIWRIAGADIYGCMDTAYVAILVERKDVIEAPSIFTPNLDGKNDQWVIGNPEVIEGCPLFILNQWGDVMYESNEYQSDWDGTTNGKNVTDGTYFYFFNCDDDTKNFTGSITVIR